MENLSVAILRYDMVERIEYQRYAEFLRLAGIYVWEQCTLFTENDGAVADPGKGILLFNVKKQDEWQDGAVTFRPDSHKEALDVLKSQWDKDLSGTEYLAAFDLLKNVFVENDLFRASVTLQYYRLKDDLVKQAGLCFENAVTYLRQEMQKDEMLGNNRHVRYAEIYCGQRANQAREWCRLLNRFDVEALADKCLDLTEDCPDFSNVWTLLGLVYQHTDEKIADCLDAYETALRYIGEYPFASSIYYWMGKRCENDRKVEKFSEGAYLKAYALEKKYRVIYKRAMLYEKRQNYRTAVEYHRACLKRIRKKGNYLDPLEQEYVFKVLIKIGYFYLKELGRTEDCVKILEDALAFRKKIEQGEAQPNESTAYYFRLYGPGEAGGYIRLALGRMKVRKAYIYLEQAYEKLGAMDLAAKYRELCEKESGAGNA